MLTAARPLPSLARSIAIAAALAASPALVQAGPEDSGSAAPTVGGVRLESPLRTAARAAADHHGASAPQAPHTGGSALAQRAEWQPTGFGLGLRTGGFHFGVGASGLGWLSDRVGVEGLVSRYSIGTSATGGGVSASSDFTVTSFSGGLRYRLGSPGGSMHPYLSAGMNVYRSSTSVNVSGYGTSEGSSDSSSNVGVYGVGGLEISFGSTRRLAASLDLGYYTTATPFPGLEVGGLAIGSALHWYFK
jgi:hypothetical protein